jgi:L-fucose isomerase-like protein
MTARGRPARRAARPSTAVAWRGRPWRDLRCGKAEASAGLATRGKGVTVQGNDVQRDDVKGGDVRRMSRSPLGELRPRPS